MAKFWHSKNKIYLYLYYYFASQGMFLPFKPEWSLFLSTKTYFLLFTQSYRPSEFWYEATVCVAATLRPAFLQVMICPENLWMRNWLLTLIFRKNKKSLWIKRLKMVRWWTAKEKKFAKLAPGNFLDWVQNQKKKTSLDFQRISHNPFVNYLISNEFHECINYISSYLPKLE